MKSLKICDWLISFSFSCLFFLVPLILTPWNYELFEYNKMMLVYALTIIITGTWLIKMVVHKRLLFRRTPFDIPILLFLVSQILSTIFSMDPHVSLFGYYSRFNGGLFSVISYLLLYYGLVSNINREQVGRFLKLSLLSALIVSLYGILEHFGIDKNLWVQDVQNRVFSTLGQPNWLGAYLAIIIPITMTFIFSYPNVIARNTFGKLSVTKQSRHAEFSSASVSKRILKQVQNDANIEIAAPFGLAMTLRNLFYYFMLSAFYLCLLYTKSRSGLMGFGIAFLVFWFLNFLWQACHPRPDRGSRPVSKTLDSRLRGNDKYNFFRPFLLLSGLCFLISILVGTPWTPSISQIINHKSEIVAPAAGPALEAGGTESGEIRKIVWSGAIEIARHYPLFGTGPETFAFSYYQFRPTAHNLTSEWDFLYNKAHNEYLNYAATTGFVGLGAYLLFIGWFLIWSFKKVFCHSRDLCHSRSNRESRPLSGRWIPAFAGMTAESGMTIGLFAAWLSILVTNFFGFSVVVISLYFWLIPAMAVVITKNDRHAEFSSASDQILKQVQNDVNIKGFSLYQYLSLFIIVLSTLYFLLYTVRFWYADVRFNAGYQLSHAGYYQQAYEPFHEAIDANPGEPFYHDELSFVDAMLAVAAFQQKESTLSAQLATEAISQNQKALEISPQNVNFYKTQTKVYYTLSSLDPNSTIFDEKALASLQIAQTLAPTDPKITYNIALLYGRLGKNREAIKTLGDAVNIKPDYQDARYALALFYHEAGKKQEAIKQLEYILKNISPNDTTIQNKLKEWGN